MPDVFLPCLNKDDDDDDEPPRIGHYREYPPPPPPGGNCKDFELQIYLTVLGRK